MPEEETLQVVHYRDVQQALDECQRELNVRSRCFLRWVSDGRLALTDAHDRYDRLATAVKLLTQLLPPAKNGSKHGHEATSSVRA
jgi:hypothetical protein